MAKVESQLKCIYPALPQTERGKFIVLGGDPRPAKGTFLYCHGNNVYMRDINKPDVCEIFSDHATQVHVAKYNQTGFYIASGDKTGKVKVWDTTGKDHLVKNEIEGLGGAIKDICWGSGTELRFTKLAFAGEGNMMYARIVTADTGNSKGAISENSKSVNNIAIRPVKPEHVVTASEDQTLQFFAVGKTSKQPYENGKNIKDHKNFVNCVRYSPKGDIFISGGADGQAIIFDGENGERVGELIDTKVKSMDGLKKAHSGGIYSICFNDDGTEFLTISGDKSAKIWNLSTKELVGEYNMGKEIKDMQVGCLWQGDNIMTVSLTGYINFLDRNNPTNGKPPHTPLKIWKGHNQPISCAAVSTDGTKLYSGSAETIKDSKNALILVWDLASGTAEEIQGQGHKSKVVDMAIVGNTLISVSIDDTVRFTSTSTNIYDDNFCKLPSQPTGVSGIEGSTVVSCNEHIVVLDDGPQINYMIQVKFEPLCVSVCRAPDGRKLAAIGTRADGFVHIFAIEAGNSLAEVHKVEVKDDAVTVAFSPDGSKLAVGTGSRKTVMLFDVNNNFAQIFSEQKHTAKILSVAWSPDGRYFVSGSLDSSITIWMDHKELPSSYNHFIRAAHMKGQVNKVRWLSSNVIASCGSDCNIKQFELKNL